VSRRDLISIANDIVGVPFKLDGRDLAGMDCWGVVLWVYERLGVALPDPCSTDRITCEASPVFHSFRSIPFAEIAPRDVLRFDASGSARHLGVFLGGGRILHAGRRAVEVRRFEPAQIESCYRFAGDFPA